MSEQLLFKQKPQINISCPSGRRMYLVALCAFLCICQSALSDNGKSLIIALTAFLTAVVLEYLLTVKKYGFAKIKDGSAAAASMVLTLLMPNMINPVYAALAAAFAIIVVKYSFGGLGSNWLNPALGGWLFARFSWPGAFTSSLDPVMPAAEMTIETQTGTIANSVSTFLNDTVFSVLGVQLPSGYTDLLFFENPGIIADRGLFALLIGTIIITAALINRGWVPLFFLLIYCFLIRFAGDPSGILWNGDMLYGLFSGGTITAAFVLAADPASSAKSKEGVFLTVLFCAILSWVFRYNLFEYTGCLIAVAVVNCFTPVIRHIEDKYFLSGNKVKIYE